MHALYCSHRKHLYCQVTINELLGRGIEILDVSPLVEVRLTPWSHYNRYNVLYALGSLYSQLFKTKQLLIELEITECKALLIIEDLVRWDIRYDEKLNIDVPFYCQVPKYLYETHTRSYHSMHLGKIEFVDDPSFLKRKMDLVYQHRPSARQSMSVQQEMVRETLLEWKCWS